jgi:Transposase
MTCPWSTRSISSPGSSSTLDPKGWEEDRVELFVGVDWAEDHHDVCVVDAEGRVVAKGRVPQGIVGVARLHELVDLGRGDPTGPVEVVVGIETDRGLLVRALLAAGYAVVAVNPMAVDRYRDRHRVSGAKSDPGDARVLADLVRTDRHLHRPVAGTATKWKRSSWSPGPSERYLVPPSAGQPAPSDAWGVLSRDH